MSVEAKSIFEAVTKPVSELLYDRGLGLYIPSYQRPYSWDKSKVDRLMEDISHGFKKLIDSNDSFTFLGTVITIHDINHSTIQPIVRDDVPGKVLTVIDGQQRMTTLLILCIALHNEISLMHKRFKKMMDKYQNNFEQGQDYVEEGGQREKQRYEENMEAFKWLDGKTIDVLTDLALTFYENYGRGNSPFYPRMIRSLEDSWSRDKDKCHYHSPAAHLTFNYIQEINKEGYQAINFRPSKRIDENIEGEADLVDRFNQLKNILRKLDKNIDDDEMEEIPTCNEIYDSKVFLENLFNPGTVPVEYIKKIDTELKDNFDQLSLLMFYANYILNRVVVTVVKGKNEDYAFTIFESLNTTGEPLTAFETFKPRVVGSVKLANYENSKEKKLLDEIGEYLSDYSASDKRQKATKDLLIAFFGAYSGLKVSGRLNEQRSKLKTAFENAQSEDKKYGDDHSQEKIRLIQTLRDCANFKNYFWETKNFNNIHQFIGDRALSNTSKLCLSFLNDLTHTIVIPILTNFFTQIIESRDNDQKHLRLYEFEEALKAIVAFSVLWRASRIGTAGIDKEYRELLSNIDATGLLPIAKIHMKDGIIDIDLFKKALKSRLIDPSRKGALKDKQGFIQKATALPIYNQKKVAKMLLLSAHNNTVEDLEKPGFLIKGKHAANSCLTMEMYQDEVSLTLEHIATQTHADKWPLDIYSNGTLVHTLGNLILISLRLNSALSNKAWQEKQTIYKAVGAKTKEEANRILIDAESKYNFNFRDSTKTILEEQNHMPNLVTLGNIEGSWNANWIEERSKHLYSLAWDELIEWLE